MKGFNFMSVFRRKKSSDQKQIIISAESLQTRVLQRIGEIQVPAAR